MKAVEVRELIKDYGKFRAIDGISFEVNEGEIFGLIGHINFLNGGSF